MRRRCRMGYFPGSGSVLLTGTAYALDAGTTPGNNGQLKVSFHSSMESC
jgi:hypothetical protein